MVHLDVSGNIVFINKEHQEVECQDFVNKFLVKYEEVKQVDPFHSTRNKKKFKTVRELRQLYTDDEQFISFPRGILELIPQTEYTATYHEQNSIRVPKLSQDDIKHSLDCFDLRDDQVIAVNKCLLCKRGVIQLPTATGKSAIITSTIKALLKENPQMHTLVIAPTLSTVKNINDTLVNNGLDAKVFGHQTKNVDSSVTTSLVQSLMALPDSDNMLDNIDAVFYDECLPGNAVVLMPDFSTRKIADVFEDNDAREIMSFNLDTNQYEVKRILHKYKTPFNSRFCKVYYQDENSNKLGGVSCTPNHKIYTRDRGYVPAEELTPEDYIKIDYPFVRNWTSLSKFTFMKVVRVSYNIGKESEYKYNLEVEGNHNYFANSVLVSNCHHLKCDTWNRLNTMLPNAEYSLGFSALSIDKSEIYKTDFRDISYESSLIIGSAGRVLMHMDPSYYIERGIIALPVVFRVNHYEPLEEGFDESNWAALVKDGLMSESRTEKVVSTAAMFAKYNRKVLILVSEKNYAFRLCKRLAEHNETRFGVSFGAGVGYEFKGFKPPKSDGELEVDYQSKSSMDVVQDLSDGNINILIATTHLDEGVDVSNLDACILSCGGKKDRRIIQRVGRVLRKSKSGKYAYVIDFTDSASIVLNRQSEKRLAMFRDEIGVPEKNIFNGVNVEDLERIFKKLEE